MLRYLKDTGFDDFTLRFVIHEHSETHYSSMPKVTNAYKNE